MDRITAVYEVAAGSSDIAVIAREIALEQTVEVPEELVRSPEIRDRIVGAVETIDASPTVLGRYRVTIGYNVELAAGQLPQLLNLLYGNISMQQGICLVDLELPPSFLERFRGPNCGVDGIRRMLGIYDRPLLATALKPRGAPVEQLAAQAHAFALGGGDIVKDDHNLVESSFDRFCDRILACRDAVRDANARTGRNTLYFPNVLQRHEDVERHIEFLVREGVPGAVVSPLVQGPDVLRVLAQRYPLAYMMHPTFTGAFYSHDSHGVEAGLLLGTLFRLAGGDCAIFPNHGGRFRLSREACLSIAQRLRQPLGALKPAFPVPAGGMRLRNLATMGETYGVDCIFLVGGGLLGHSDDLADSTRRFLDAIREHFPERQTMPEIATPSACEASAATSIPAEILPFLGFQGDFTWQGRSPTIYKQKGSLPFQGVTRTELVGGVGERTVFDLRYFEVEPGGYTSLEKHAHTHTIVCIRGRGILTRHGETHPLQPFDIAYVAPLEPHQLRNESTEPFGFLCIVDHDRDRPMMA